MRVRVCVFVCVQDDILQRLANAEGDITSDVDLIVGLEDTKRIANDIAERQKVAKQTEIVINVTSEKYRPVAARGSLTFFLMNELFKVHTYYIYSLSAFVTIFLRSIDLVSGDQNPMKEELEEAERLAEAGEGEGEGEGEEGGAAAGAAEGGAATGAAEDSAAPSDASSSGKVKAGLSDEQLKRRCDILKDSVTKVSFFYINRGLFERDKLMVAAQLCFQVMVRDDRLSAEQLGVLVQGKADINAGNMGPLSDWMPELMWQKVKGLEVVEELKKLGDEMQQLPDAWLKWFDEEKPDAVPCPGIYKTLSPFHRMLILRVMRPDRMRVALTQFVHDQLGEVFVNPPQFDMTKTYEETSNSTPVFFVLFPGTDPTVWVEGLARQMGFSSDNGKFRNISMGQGQEKPAEAAIADFARDGGWLMLQNVHLMQSWLPQLERQLEIAAETAHPSFRCFISAEPPGFSYMKNMPESLMQSCIKVSNEAPSDMRSNLARSWAYFSQDTIDSCSKPTEFKTCLLTLCFYHSIVLGRKKFGQQGWSKRYSFNQGDLTVCADVLLKYISTNTHVPWEDMRYVFGQIMYGGHITDAWDRRCNNTYLDVYMQPGIFHGCELAPGFKVPDTSAMSYDDVLAYFSTALPAESPPMFGLHPNAEIGYLTTFAEDLFQTILILGGTGGGAGASGSLDSIVRTVLEDILERCPEDFQMIDIKIKAEALTTQPSFPYVLVAMQECERMNRLLGEIRRSLIELRKGLDGQLNMSEPMEDLMQALSINQVPGRNVFHKTSWEKLAWPSRKSLQMWFSDMLLRVEQVRMGAPLAGATRVYCWRPRTALLGVWCARRVPVSILCDFVVVRVAFLCVSPQLERWVVDLVEPYSLWLPGLFNPMAFVTAIMQVTARATGLPLDKMSVETHVTTMMRPEVCTQPRPAPAHWVPAGACWCLLVPGCVCAMIVCPCVPASAA